MVESEVLVIFILIPSHWRVSLCSPNIMLRDVCDLPLLTSRGAAAVRVKTGLWGSWQAKPRLLPSTVAVITLAIL
jgi:hypothetical protein